MKKRMPFTLLLVSSVLVACSTKAPESSNNYYRSSQDSNLVACPASVVYSPTNVIILENNHQANTYTAEYVTDISINVYNQYGIKCQQAEINEKLKEEAYAVGGNIVILVENASDKKHIHARVLRSITNPVSPNAAAGKDLASKK